MYFDFGFLLAWRNDAPIAVVKIKALDFFAAAAPLLSHSLVLSVLTFCGTDAQYHSPMRRAALL